MNLYMFRVYLSPLSGVQPYVYDSWYILSFLDDCLLSWLDWIDDGPKYARHMYSLTKCTKNKFCIKLVSIYTIVARRTVNRT